MAWEFVVSAVRASEFRDSPEYSPPLPPQPSRHLRRAALEQHHPQARIHRGITPAELRGNGDLLAQLGEDLSALGIQCAFEVLNFRPLAMSGHVLVLVENGQLETTFSR